MMLSEIVRLDNSRALRRWVYVQEEPFLWGRKNMEVKWVMPIHTQSYLTRRWWGRMSGPKTTMKKWSSFPGHYITIIISNLVTFIYFCRQIECRWQLAKYQPFDLDPIIDPHGRISSVIYLDSHLDGCSFIGSCGTHYHQKPGRVERWAWAPRTCICTF